MTAYFRAVSRLGRRDIFHFFLGGGGRVISDLKSLFSRTNWGGEGIAPLAPQSLEDENLLKCGEIMVES